MNQALKSTFQLPKAYQAPPFSDALMTNLARTHPELWKGVETEVKGLFQSFDASKIADYANALQKKEGDLQVNKISKVKIEKKSVKAKPVHSKTMSTEQELIKIKLTRYAIHKTLQHMLSSSQAQTLAQSTLKTRNIDLSSLDLRLAQWLFFTSEGARKSVSAFFFPIFWSFIQSKGGVLQKLKDRGIYCVFSKEFGQALARIIGSKNIVELGAGDGTLTLLLESHGCKNVLPTDDKSWRHVVTYPDWVETLEASEALHKYRPEVVVCSWPPPDNNFESQVFELTSVQTYIVVGSQHTFATGNRKAYQNALGFECEHSPLSKLIFPREICSEVLIFRRKTPAT